MATFCERFGKRNPFTSPVRTRFQESDNGKRLELALLFSPELVADVGWMAGDLLDVSRDGLMLIVQPHRHGRKLHGKPPYVQFSFTKPDQRQVIEFFGFDVRQSHFWERIQVQNKRLLLLLKDINQPVL